MPIKRKYKSSGAMSGVQTPAQQTPQKADGRPSLISCGKNEKKVLKCLYEAYKNNERFSVRGTAKKTGIPRGSISDILNNLKNKNLIDKPYIGQYIITDYGKQVSENLSDCLGEGVRKGSTERADKEFLSTHWIQYKADIDRSNFNLKQLKERANEYYTHTIQNLTQHIFYFDNHTIIINPYVAVIKIWDITTNNVHESDMKAFEKVTKILENLSSTGLQIKNLHVEKGHWARIHNYVADFLDKKDNNFYVEVNGKKIWIDHSLGPPELETNDRESAEKLENLMESVIETNRSFYDVDKLVQVTANLVKLQFNQQIQNHKELLQQQNQQQNNKPDYAL